MIENKEKALTIPPTKANVKGILIGVKPDILCSDYTILKKSEGIIMKRNLIVGSILIGGIFGLLPAIAKIFIFTGLAVYLFFKYDEWSYNHDHTVGGAE